MPIHEVLVKSLHPVSEFYLTNSIIVRKYYEDNYVKGVDENELVDEAVVENIHMEEVQLMLMCSVAFVNKLLKTKPVQSALKKIGDHRDKFYLITLTSDPNVSEEDNMINITRYRKAHFDKYKYVYVAEKHSANSERYHQHILIECPYRVQRTDQNLKPANYYKGNINVKPVTMTRPSVLRIIQDYFSKENKPLGDLDYFLKYQF